MSRLLALLVLLGFLVASCDDVPVQDPIGVRLSPQGKTQILYVLCPGEEIETVSLSVAGSDEDGSDQRKVWEITSEGAVREQFVVGSAPAHFETEMPLKAAVPKEAQLVAVVESSEGPLSLFFKTNELSREDVLVFGRDRLSLPDFRSRGLERCS